MKNRFELSGASSSSDSEGSTCPQQESFSRGGNINASEFSSWTISLDPFPADFPALQWMGKFGLITMGWASLALALLLKIIKGVNCKRTRIPIDQTTEQQNRKRDFLSRSSSKYGYKDSPKGFIDTWRTSEFPLLVRPCDLDDSPSTPSPTIQEHEVYLDYAGSALPSLSQGKALFDQNYMFQILANPHSSGPAASRTLLKVKEMESQVLEFLGATPGRYASRTSPASPDGQVRDEYHPGYDIVFTSGTSESLRIVAEKFQFPMCSKCKRRSTFLFPHNAHTSVIGMRGPAQANGARFECQLLDDIEQRKSWNDSDCSDCECQNLLVFPMECNFGGTRPDSRAIIQSAHLSGTWRVMLDIAKAVSTGPVNLKALNPDFACLSFYKIFGTPTGLGALLIKRAQNAITAISPRQSPSVDHHYFGGGAVDLVLPKQDVAFPRTDLTKSLNHGTIHFRGILSLQPGFEDITSLGGMTRIQDHTSELASELTSRLRGLHHGNGKPAIQLYGAWKDAELEEGTSRGPTVAFNVLRHDGSYVGYNEVSKLASLNRPPIQLRSGCFCNPGACQQALGYSDDDLLSNYKISGHVCGDHIDILKGMPTGAVRVSFGKDSTWEDLDYLCSFLEESFVNHSANVQDEKCKKPSATEATISELYIFPIKSCAAQRVRKWQMELPCGKLAFDREFALVDSSGSAIRLQSCPKMSQLKPVIDSVKHTMTVSAPGCADLVIDLNNSRYTDDDMCDVIKVCGNKCSGRLWGDHDTSKWFSDYLGVQCWLARYSDGAYRMAESRSVSPSRDSLVAFANEQPILLVANHAVSVLNTVLEAQHQPSVTARQFRPNIVVQGVADSSHCDDDWKVVDVQGKDIRLDARGACARCAMVDFCPSTGRKVQTLRALASYRRRQGQIVFGTFFKGFCKNGNLPSQKPLMVEEGDKLICS